MNDDAADLARLILEPAETLEVEYKAWLDLQNTSHQAKLAKELIALRNHGGGFLVLGFSDPEMMPIERPEGYEYVTTDHVNGIVASFADPPFHCQVVTVSGHPIISVPAGATVPIRSKRSSGKDIMQDRYYIRRPGPNSEPPQSGFEWDALLRRCFENRDAELETMVRRVLRVMVSPSETLTVTGPDRISELLK